MQKICLQEKLERIEGHWDPHIVAELNGQKVMLARLQGEFVWHRHDQEDELFYVLQGVLDIEFRDRTETLHPGEMLVVPQGVEHRPVAHGEVQVMLFEPLTTRNTGDVENERTVPRPRRI